MQGVHRHDPRNGTSTVGIVVMKGALTREICDFHQTRQNHAKAFCGCCRITTPLNIQVVFAIHEIISRKFFFGIFYMLWSAIFIIYFY
jgi:uncharacterized membrane protein YcfT